MSAAQELAQKLAEGGTAADARKLAAFGAEAIPAIAPFLATGWNAEVTPATALRMVRGKGIVAALTSLTASSDGEIRAAAIEALGHSKLPDALGPLLELLRNGRGIVDVAGALGELGSPGAIGPLQALWAKEDIDALFSDEYENMRGLWNLAAIGGALLRLGATGVETGLARLARASDIAVALEAIAGLRWSGEPVAIRAIRDAANSDRDELADAAVEALGALGLPAVAPVLLAVASSRPQRYAVVRHAFYAMFGGQIPQSDDVTALREWWDQSSERWPRDRHIWWGGEDLGQAISMLAGRDGGIARTHLELWTGVDMVDTAERGVAGDHNDVVRASLWWQHVNWDWDPDAVYRARRRLEAGPIVAALEGKLPAEG